MKTTKEKVLHLYEEGYTQSQIAATVGVSRQRVSQILCVGSKGKHFKEVTEKTCKYVNLRNWMNENQITFSQLGRMVYGHTGNEHYSQIRGWISDGKSMTKKNIDRMIAATGLSYDKLFEVG